MTQTHLTFSDSGVDAIARRAVARAIERHRRLGESIAVWRDGQIVIVPPEEIPPLDLAVWNREDPSGKTVD